jgi:capsular polysaccharide biosynthesis protein
MAELLPELLNVALTTPNGVFDPAHGNLGAAGASHIGMLAPAGRYTRAPPFHVDTAQADPETRATLDRYFGWTIAPCPSLRTVRLAGALLTGQGAIVTRDHRLVAETVTEFTAQNRVPDGFTAAPAGGYHFPARFDAHISQPCILAKRPWYRNYGHWLVDGATVLALAADIIQSERLTIVLGHCDPLAAVMEETIARLVPGAEVLRHKDHEIWRFDQLRYVAPPHVPPLFKSPEALRRLRAAFVPPPPVAPPPLPHRKLFVSRRHAATRRLVNEDELFALCAARGFERVEPERLTLAEQANLFAAATAVIGPKGAALTNTLFCAPGAKTMLLSPADFPDPFFWDLCAQTGAYAEVFGPITTSRPQGMNDFQIDPARLTAMLDAAAL